MSKKLSASFFLLALGWMMTFSITSSDGKSGKTGAPDEGDCTQCHGGTAVNAGVGSVSVSTGMASGYVPGEVYGMSVTVSQVGISLFGFSIVALDANGASVGTFTAGADNHTENLTIAGNIRQYVTHNFNGGASAGSHTFSFDWTAPASDAGAITFYVSANAANGNGGTSGDFIYTTSTSVSASLGGGGSFVINEIDVDQAGTDNAEFIELFGTPGTVLDGNVLVFFNGNNATEASYFSLDITGVIPNTGFFVIGNPGVSNVNLVIDPGASGAIQNGADAIAIYSGSAASWPSGTSPVTTNLIDAVVYGTDDTEDTGLMGIFAPGQTQTNESPSATMSISRVPDGGNPLDFASYLSQLPTPGASNNNAPTMGCTDAAACNFNPSATVSDASCLFLGFPCDDGNAATSNDVITPECTCAGTQTIVTWTFRVDMSTTPVNAPGVYIAGTFQGWVPNQDLMTDTDGDNVWEITVDSIPVNTPIEYKFLNGTDGWESSPDLANCGVDDLFNAFNRADTTGTIDEILPVVCFNSCSACVTTDVPGCTDVNACNYNSAATIDDGSCIDPTTWYLDADADGYYVSDSIACSAPSAQYTSTMGNMGDCDDAQASINSGAIEICGNGIDEDCSGSDLACGVGGCTDPTACNFEPLATVDNGSCVNPTMWYLDADNDGYYVDDSLSCVAPTVDYTATMGIADDCDDAQASINSGASEICDAIDNDCDLEIDEFVENTYYLDADADGFGDVNTAVLSCLPVAGYVDNSDDCDDTILLYLDNDGDSFGGQVLSACGELTSDDCDDNSATVYPGAFEFCENITDENCDGLDDICTGVPGCTDTLACNYDSLAESNNGSCIYAQLWYLDADADGFASDTTSNCDLPGASYTSTVLPINDCNDSDALINVGATEICGNDVDEDCSGTVESCAVAGCTDSLACNFEPTATEDDSTCTYAVMWYADLDQDGFASDTLMSCSQPGPEFTDVVIPVTDCDDLNPSISPVSMEICGNGIDEDCSNEDEICIVAGCMDTIACNYNPEANEDDSTCFYNTTWYLDTDGDGYYTSTIDSCYTPGAGYSSVPGINGDCNDTLATINAGVAEICLDDIDNNCNGMVDENTGSTWFQDVDADGFGNPAVDSVSCESPVGFVLDSLDCNDTLAIVNPDGIEICGNDIDEDCNGEDLVCDLSGCTDTSACNYNPLAVISDSSCYFVGDVCDDGNANTINDQIQNDCVCSGLNPECVTNPIIISLDSLHNVTCFNGDDGFIGLNVSGGNTPYFASWNSFPIQTTPFASGLIAGSYTLTIEDAEGCIQTFTQEVTQPEGSLPVVSGNNDVNPADNEQYTVNTYPGCTYAWTVSNGLILSGQDNDTLNVLWNDAAMGTIYVYQTDTVTGCQWMDGLAVFINAVGTEEIASETWKIYPNPASDLINIAGLSINSQVIVMDATGRIINQFNATETTLRLNVSDYESGIYFIQVKDDFGYRTERLIKQ